MQQERGFQGRFQWLNYGDPHRRELLLLRYRRTARKLGRGGPAAVSIECSNANISFRFSLLPSAPGLPAIRRAARRRGWVGTSHGLSSQLLPLEICPYCLCAGNQPPPATDAIQGQYRVQQSSLHTRIPLTWSLAVTTLSLPGMVSHLCTIL